MKALGKIIMSLLLIFLIGTVGFAQNQGQMGQPQGQDYSSWDANQDNRIDTDEFRSGLNNTNSYGNWDANSDMRLDENEWNEGVSTYYDDYDGAFDDWDANDDNYLDEDEYLEGTFDLWDDDNDGYIDNDEYDARNENGIFER